MWFLLLWVLCSAVAVVLSSGARHDGLPDVRCLIRFPVGWGNSSLCYAELHYDPAGPGAREQAASASRSFCSQLHFESLVLLRPDEPVRAVDLADASLLCGEQSHVVPTLHLTSFASGVDDAVSTTTAATTTTTTTTTKPRDDGAASSSSSSSSSSSCAACVARGRCEAVLGMAFEQRLVHSEVDGRTLVLTARKPRWDLPRMPLPTPELYFPPSSSSSSSSAAAAGGRRISDSIRAPADGVLPDALLRMPLRIALWNPLYRGFFRERKSVSDALTSHPSLSLLDVSDKTWDDLFVDYMLGNSSCHFEKTTDAEVDDLLLKRRSAFAHKEARAGFLDRLGADIIVWVVDTLEVDWPSMQKMSSKDAKMAALFDPRGIIPPSRLIILDMRDNVHKEWSPGLAAVASLHAALLSAPPSSSNVFDTTLASTSQPPSLSPPARMSSAAFVASHQCALYLERTWSPRLDGTFVEPHATVLRDLWPPNSPDATASERGVVQHLPVDFAIHDEFLPRYAGGITAALPLLPAEAGEEAEAEEWAVERPIRVACLLRPFESMQCRVRVLDWVADFCLQHGLHGEQCFVGQWSDARRDTYDLEYLNILRLAQVVVIQKPCLWDGDYRTWETLASGAAVAIDQPDRTLEVLSRSPLRPGVHVHALNTKDRASFMQGLAALATGPPLERYRIAKRGHLMALKYHRSVSRVDEAFEALGQVWDRWSKLTMGNNVVSSTVPPLLSLTPTVASTCPYTEAVPAGAAPPAEVFWHVALFDEGEESAGVGIAREQYEAMMNAGIADLVDRINIFVAGPNEKLLAEYRRGELDPKVVVHPKNSSLADFQFSTLSSLQDYCRKTPSAFVLYIHNKGASRLSSDQAFVRGHRKYMEHFVLSRSRSCLASLRNGASACGVQLNTRPYIFDTFPGGAARFYAGNFWWARCEHVNHLPDVGKMRAWKDKRLAEAWIGFAEKACMMNCVHLKGKNLKGKNFHTDLTLSEEYESDKGCDEQLNSFY